MPDEVWRDFVRRSCKEVKNDFDQLLSGLDVYKLVAEFQTLSTVLNGRDPKAALLFIAYFVTEQEYVAL